MTVGRISNEGEVLLANLIFKGSDVNRGTNLQLLLFTNSTLTDTSTYSSIIEPTGNGYARITLLDANWTITPDTGVSTVGAIASYAAQAFIPSSGTSGWSNVQGAALVTTGTSPKLLAFIYDTAAPLTISAGIPYNVTLSIPVGRLA